MENPSGSVEAGNAAIYRVGDLVVDFGRAQVFRDGVELPLPKLSFDFLRVLMQDAPRIVTIDALMDRVWAGVVVSPETVSQRAKLLRDALGDDSRQPRYVAVVRGRGYRLVADVNREIPAEPAPIVPGPAAQPVESVPPAPVESSTSRALPGARTWLLVVILAAVVPAGVFVVYQRETTASSMAAAQQAAGTGPAVKSSVPVVAVLPFESVGTARGDALSFGIAEAVLHQLANLREVNVIARTSSFSYTTPSGDVKQIGRDLGANYLVEGSVQQDSDRLRVTAQLIDTATGAHVWSMQFDEARDDVFKVQDTIATQVARAMQLSLDAPATDRVTGQGTTNFDAYLAFLQGQEVLRARRLSDAGRAIESFRTAVALDPSFAPAWVALAEAEVFVAEYDARQDRPGRFLEAIERAEGYIARALEFDPDLGAAYIERGHLQAFTDLGAAAASYRRGIELAPNDARGHAGLAAVLFEDSAQRPEALALIERARRLDPLEPAHDVTLATFVLYDRGDVREAEALLRNVLRRQPLYQPAIARLGELSWCCAGRGAEAIRFLEQALALDGASDWTRRLLVRAYLVVDDVDAARAVVQAAPSLHPLLQLPIAVYGADWRAAGELAYAGFEEGLVTPADAGIATLAVRRHARVTGEYDRAMRVLAQYAGLRWSDDGTPLLSPRPGLREADIGVADLLVASGQRPRGVELGETILAQVDAELAQGGRGDFWYMHAKSTLPALLGRDAEALAALRRGIEAGALAHRERDLFEQDPLLDRLRGNAAFREMVAGLRAEARASRERLEKLRAEGLVPHRP